MEKDSTVFVLGNTHKKNAYIEDTEHMLSVKGSFEVADEMGSYRSLSGCTGLSTKRSRSSKCSH